jgi:hypothetical protein
MRTAGIVSDTGRGDVSVRRSLARAGDSAPGSPRHYPYRHTGTRRLPVRTRCCRRRSTARRYGKYPTRRHAGRESARPIGPSARRHVATGSAGPVGASVRHVVRASDRVLLPSPWTGAVNRAAFASPAPASPPHQHQHQRAPAHRRRPGRRRRQIRLAIRESVRRPDSWPAQPQRETAQQAEYCQSNVTGPPEALGLGPDYARRSGYVRRQRPGRAHGDDSDS